MRKINFTKMVASGNDFVVINNSELEDCNLRLSVLTKNLCDRKYGIGADGILVLGKSKKAGIRMKIFNADGSEAEMCGNGARCAALPVAGCRLPVAGSKGISIETKAGIIESEVKGDKVRIRLTDPKGVKLGIPLNIGNKSLRVNFVDTGVPHAVVFVNGLEDIDVTGIGREIRFHKTFAPKGANVNFVEVLKDNLIYVRTYERGVEGETLACGTGSVAAALITAYSLKLAVSGAINVTTRGGETLRVYFDKCDGAFKNIWLEGKARIVYKGEYYV
ncbi:MAG: diaminopimelate epimerase [Candidatus Omnitrophica bacterium]|nr:diaminopimelate epimerase [Candidatus Omnitrophota bacterium]